MKIFKAFLNQKQVKKSTDFLKVELFWWISVKFQAFLAKSKENLKFSSPLFYLPSFFLYFMKGFEKAFYKITRKAFWTLP